MFGLTELVAFLPESPMAVVLMHGVYQDAVDRRVGCINGGRIKK